MYDRSIVEKRLEVAARELGFMPEYHTPSEIDDFDKRLESKYAVEYAAASQASQGSKESLSVYQTSLIRSLANAGKLSSDEIRWINNERALCMCDAHYFLSSYYWIKTQTRIIRFEFRAGQQIYFNVIAALHKIGAPIEIIMAKARQLGISTVTEGLMVHAINFGYGVNAVVASADQTKTSKMSQMTFLGYDMMPWWMRAPWSRRVESNQGMLVLGDLRSGISFQHGSQVSGIGRGDTVLKYHLSECASFTDPVQQIEAALWRCVHPHPDVLGVLESTAEGNTGWFYDNYWDNKKKRAAGQPSRLFSLFLPWFIGTDQYPNPTWIKQWPVPHEWRPIEETRSMMLRAKDYIKSNTVLEDVLGADWQMGREQAWYWESHYLESRSKGTEKLWFQEMPTDDQEAFQSSYDNVFGREVIAEVDARRRSEYHVYAVIGQSIEGRYEPEEYEKDLTEPIVPITFSNRRGVSYKWEFVPLIWNEWENGQFKSSTDIRADNDSADGKLFVWLEPKRGYDYSIGIRTGNGIGSGDTVITVSQRARGPHEPDEQAAEFRSSIVSHVEAYSWALAIATYYSRYMGDHGVKYREPYIAIEQAERSGDLTYTQMRKMGYRRFHKMTRYDSKAEDMRQQNRSKVGWFSFGWSTPMYTDSFVVWVRNGWYRVNSPFTIREMDRWEAHVKENGKIKYIHSEESTDSGVLANAMAAFCVNDLKPLAERTVKRFMECNKSTPAKLDISPTLSGTTFPLSASYNVSNDTIDAALRRFNQ